MNLSRHRSRILRIGIDLPAILKRLHGDERGAVSLETVLIIGAICLPILIFTIKYGWPRIRDYFSRNVQTLENESNRVSGNQ
jgi:hypothetical protein